jgi:signal transduction histidine kinase
MKPSDPNSGPVEPAPRPAAPALDPTEAAQYALLHRPSLGIRMKIALCFLLCFLVIGGLTLMSSLVLRRIELRLHFLELADDYTSLIQQARRYEKNYLLYGSDLGSALDHVSAARAMLTGAADEVAHVVGVSAHAEMVRHLERYEQLLVRLRDGGADADRDRPAVEAELRQHGADMIDTALRVVRAERETVRALLQFSKLMPLAALVLLLALIAYVVRFLTRQIVAPLGRMVDYARRIADGDTTPILPVRRHRDEFTDLVLAMNHMTHELDRRQEMLAEAQKLRAIGTLTAGVAHELNNPLNNVSLTAEALLEDYDSLSDKDRLDMCRDLLAESARAQGVVRNLLDFSRQSEPSMEPIDLRETLEQATRLLRHQTRLAGVRFELETGAAPVPIRGDRQQLAQVFVNLYLNAIESTGQGGHLRVRVAAPSDRPGFVRVDVTDTGKGIAPEILPYVFDPFFSTKGTKGTGLGLSVSYGIVAEHGGKIEVRSHVGEGTTFSVHLPAAGGPADAPAG